MKKSLYWCWRKIVLHKIAIIRLIIDLATSWGEPLMMAFSLVKFSYRVWKKERGNSRSFKTRRHLVQRNP